MTDLRPCPFCGTDNVDLADTGAHWVRCLMADCGCEGPVCDTAEYAVASWNRRSGDHAQCSACKDDPIECAKVPMQHCKAWEPLSDGHAERPTDSEAREAIARMLVPYWYGGFELQDIDPETRVWRKPPGTPNDRAYEIADKMLAIVGRSSPAENNADVMLLKQFADAYRSGAHGAHMEADDAQAVAQAIDRLVGSSQPVTDESHDVSEHMGLDGAGG